jgi:hypothetical protein
VVDECCQGVVALGLLPGRGHVLLVGVGDHEDAVEVEQQQLCAALRVGKAASDRRKNFASRVVKPSMAVP